ncbi:golgin subfamily A member 6-like protein 25 [Anolis sagrei]|uniref:golgin subfamily A member 6-like protein 25 n=1 Tax=Anolis sagrei TaxID=38937 RepID=UPI0035228346
MYNTRNKAEKMEKGERNEKSEKEQKEVKSNTRRLSLVEEQTIKDMLEKMTEKMMTELKSVKEKQDAAQKASQEQIADLKREIKEEIGGVKKELTSMQQEFKELKMEKTEIKKTQEVLQVKVKTLEQKAARLEEKCERMEAKELEFQLRLRNVDEDPKENIREKVIEILAEFLEYTDQEMQEQTDRVYRVNTNFATRNRVARDVVVHFAKKSTRDEILRTNNRRTVYFRGKKIIILKEYPTTVLTKRRKYNFLTEELKKRRIRYRWEREEGLMASYGDQRYWIKNTERAKEFLEKIKREEKEKNKYTTKGKPKIKNPEEETGKEESEREKEEQERAAKRNSDGRNLNNIEQEEPQQEMTAEGEIEENEEEIEEEREEPEEEGGGEKEEERREEENKQ